MNGVKTKQILDDMSSAIFRDFEEFSKYHHDSTRVHIDLLETPNVHFANCIAANRRYGDEIKEIMKRAYRVRDYCSILSCAYRRVRSRRLKKSEFIDYILKRILIYEGKGL